MHHPPSRAERRTKGCLDRVTKLATKLMSIVEQLDETQYGLRHDGWHYKNGEINELHILKDLERAISDTMWGAANVPDRRF